MQLRVVDRADEAVPNCVACGSSTAIWLRPLPLDQVAAGRETFGAAEQRGREVFDDPARAR